MDKHTLKVLEYDSVLTILADCTATVTGRELALAVTPSVHPEIVARLQAETRQARSLLDSGAGIPLGGIHNIADCLRRADIRQPLTGHELLNVGETVAAIRRLHAHLHRNADNCALFVDMTAELRLSQPLETRISQCLDSESRVRDSASNELERLRAALRQGHARLRDRLAHILASSRLLPHLQEAIVTVRDGRYCIPIKAEYRSQFPGIVHDISASGATLFVEPLTCVDLGNDVKELALLEEQEVARILYALTELVAREAASLRMACVAAAQIDLACARALVAVSQNAVEPDIVQGAIVKLCEARHPLLAGHVVPIDVEVGIGFSVLLITGPNTGGKTVALKTAGLLVLMAQSGMQVPAGTGTQLSIFRQAFADIGDEQDIRQSLSTFSAHMTNLTRILTALEPGALVLLDEVGAGTDPAEGAALARAIVEHLHERGARVIATTHYGELKEFAAAVAGVENASVEFDRESLRPTYRIELGVPGSSHAVYIAQRLGVPQSVLERATAHIRGADSNSTELLRGIEESRRAALQMERDAQFSKAAADLAKAEYEDRVREVSDIQRTARRDAEEEARQILRHASQEAESIIGELRKMNKGQRKGPAVRKRLAEVRRGTLASLTDAEEIPEYADMPAGHLFHRGDGVTIITWGVHGEIDEEPRGAHVAVRVGSMRTVLPLDVLRPAESPRLAARIPGANSSAVIQMDKAIKTPTELMLRAMRVDEANRTLERYIDDAYTAGHRKVRVIHGKGTGALRKAIGELLSVNPLVAAFGLADAGEGGDGVTVVELKD